MKCLLLFTFLYIFSTNAQINPVETPQATATTKFKLCVPFTKTQDCLNLNRGNSEVTCVLVMDSTDCAQKLMYGLVDFGKFSAEQAIISSYFFNEDGKNKIVTVGETRNEEKVHDEFAFTAVVIVNTTNINGTSLTGNNNLKYCHPGVGLVKSGWSDRVLKEFDLKYANANNKLRCDEWRSELENEYISISETYGDSCRPGQWASDRTMDETLKNQFPNLCKKCPINNVTCSYGPDMYSDPHRAAVACLRDNRNPGDLAFVDKYYAQVIIQSMNSTGSDFSLVCPDLRISKSLTNCYWARQAWNSIISRADKSSALSPKLSEWLKPLAPRQLGVEESSDRATDGWIRALNNILLDDYEEYIGIAETTVKNHVSKGRKLPDLSTERSCTGQGKWCTLENEKAKCEWMATAALVGGIVPPIKCITGKDNLQCARLIGDHQVDVTVTNINDAYISHMWDPKLIGTKVRIEPNKYLETASEYNRRIIAMVKPQSDILNATNVKGKKTCFPVIDGLAYGVFLRDAMNLEQLPGACPYHVATNNYVGDSCVPGSESIYNYKELCELCKEAPGNQTPMPSNRCSATTANYYYNDTGAIRCLHSGQGDIAFVDLENARQSFANNLIQDADESDFRVVCGQAGQPKSLIDAESCSLIEVPIGAILSRAALEPHSFRDVHNLLHSLDSSFGINSGTHPATTFNIYGPFNGTKNLIFPEKTVGILSSTSTFSIINQYTGLINTVVIPCGTGGYSSASSIYIIPITYLITLFLAIFNN